MKTKSLILVLTLILANTFAFAQDELFKVLASKGGNKLQNTSSTEWKPVFVGKKLQKGDKITIAENGYLGLAHKSGKTIELKKPGVYEVSKLSGEVAVQNASTSKKYVDYIAGEMSKTGGEDMAKNRYKYMAVTGSVERGDAQIKLYGPDKATVLSQQVLLKWEPVKGVSGYVVEITNLFGDKILTKETTETSLLVNLDSKKDKNYVWRVVSKDDSKVFSDPKNLNYLSDDKAAVLNKQATELKAQLGEESALNDVVLASFYEDNKLYLEAMQSYEAATKLEPEVEDYQIAYGQFLERTGLAKTTEQK